MLLHLHQNPLDPVPVIHRRFLPRAKFDLFHCFSCLLPIWTPHCPSPLCVGKTVLSPLNGFCSSSKTRGLCCSGQFLGCPCSSLAVSVCPSANTTRGYHSHVLRRRKIRCFLSFIPLDQGFYLLEGLCSSMGTKEKVDVFRVQAWDLTGFAFNPCVELGRADVFTPWSLLIDEGETSLPLIWSSFLHRFVIFVVQISHLLSAHTISRSLEQL